MDIVTMLVKNEDLKLKPYKDTVGKWTLGAGRNLDDVGISHEEALYLLNNDIIRAKAELQHHLPWHLELDEVRQAVLIDMCFNMGIDSLLGFKNTLELIQQNKFKEASENLLKSKWATQVGNRAQKDSFMMETGQWPK